MSTHFAVMEAISEQYFVKEQKPSEVIRGNVSEYCKKLYLDIMLIYRPLYLNTLFILQA